MPLFQKMRELGSIFWRDVVDAIRGRDLQQVFRGIDRYDGLLQEHAGLSLSEARSLEIGYGSRPNRLIAMTSMGMDAHGIDMDAPLLRGSPSEFMQTYRVNGFERAAKSLIGFVCFGLAERRRLARQLRARGYEMKVLEDRFLVGDVAQADLADESFHLIYSHNVFEHIPSASLEVLVPKMVRWLKRGGVALVQLGVFTGIIGGHLAEWFPSQVRNTSMRRRSEPWEHLRKKRYHANTYLNELTRSDYRALFAQSFEIVEEVVRIPELGKEYFTPEVAKELAAYSEEELFSNEVLYVLKPRA